METRNTHPDLPGFDVARRNNLLRIAGLAIATPAASILPLQAIGQSYPTRPIRMVVGFSPGGGPDLVARPVAKEMSEILGQSVVVENRSGAGGTIAEALVAGAPADGYTILMCSNSLSINPNLYKKLSYDADRDLLPVSLVGVSANVLVLAPSLGPISSVADLIALAKSRPGQLTFASSGVGSGSHLAGELFKLMSGVDMLHIPYKGGGQGVQAVLSGETSIMFAAIAAALPLIRSGQLRALAVTTAKRSGSAPDIPTMSEAGLKGYEAYPWYGVVVPKDTPKPIVDALQSSVVKALLVSELRERMMTLGVDLVGDTPTEFSAFIKDERARWARVIRETKITAS